LRKLQSYVQTLFEKSDRSNYLERVTFQHFMDDRGYAQDERGSHKRRYSWTRFEEVGVIANFPQLHEDIDDAHELPTGQGFFGPGKIIYVITIDVAYLSMFFPTK